MKVIFCGIFGPYFLKQVLCFSRLLKNSRLGQFAQKGQDARRAQAPAEAYIVIRRTRKRREQRSRLDFFSKLLERKNRVKISKKGEYAIRALINLALNYGNGVSQIQDIAEKEDIPEKFLEQILLSLKNAGFLQSKRGKGGGYFLDKSPDKIKIGEVIRLIDGPLAPLACVSATQHEVCSKEADCGLRSVMLDVKNAISEILDHITLDDVCKRIKGIKERRVETLMYNI